MGYNCTNCHGNEVLGNWDRYADDIPVKQTARRMVRDYQEAGAHRMIFLARQPGNEFLTDLEQIARKFIAPG